MNEQTTPGGQWIRLGTQNFDVGTNGYVQLSDSNGGQYTNADAIKLVFLAATAPVAPTLNNPSPGSGYVDLSWNRPICTAAFKVKYGTTSGLYTTTLTTTATSLNVSGLTNGVKYYFAVVGYNTNGDGLNSAEQSATPTPVVVVDNPGAETTGTWTTATVTVNYYGSN